MAASDDRPTLTKEAMGIQPGIPLQVSDGGIEELRKDIQRLMDIEAIKQVKHAYFRCVDTCNLEEMAELLFEDSHVHYIGGNYEWKFDDRSEFLKNLRESFTQSSIGHHNAHTPEIQMLSETTATGIWYFCDDMYVLDLKYHVTGSGIYFDEYEKRDGRWRIRTTKYRRLYEWSGVSAEQRTLTSHYLGQFGPEQPSRG